MPRLLVINPNTSQRVSMTIDALVREEVGDGISVETVTAGFGFDYISSRAAVAIAAHAVLDAAARAITDTTRPDAIVLGCFGDPGLEALNEMTGLPVVGFAEAGLLAAAALPEPFLVATRGEVWCDLLAELTLKLGLQDRVTAVYSIEHPNEDTEGVVAALNERARATGAGRIVLGGAGMIPFLPAIIDASPLPVLDPHRAGIRKALRLAAERQAAPGQDAGGETRGLSPALTRALSADGRRELKAEGGR